MSLAGVLFDDQKMEAYCQNAVAAADRSCDYAGDNGDAPANDVAQPPTTDFSDARIRTFVAPDPALGPGFSDFTAVDAEVRLLIVGSEQNDFLPIGVLSNQYDAKVTLANNPASHQSV